MADLGWAGGSAIRGAAILQDKPLIRRRNPAALDRAILKCYMNGYSCFWKNSFLIMQLHDPIVAPTAPGRRFNRAGLRTRTAILRAAIEVIAGHSLSGTTIERVAEKAGIAVGTVMLHFKRKEALLVAVLEHISDEFENASRNAIAKLSSSETSSAASITDRSRIADGSLAPMPSTW